MSAFIVSNKTINIIVNWLRYDKEHPGNSNTYGYAAKRIEKLGFNLSNKESAEMLCHELYNLNYQAVNARYSENNQHSTTSFNFVADDPASMIQAYKSLACFVYQCSEGNIPKTFKLYQALKEIRHIVAERIVCGLSEYAQARWDK